MEARAPAPSPSRAGAAAVALTALALVSAAPAAADPLPTGVSIRPQTVEEVQRRLADLGFLPESGVDGIFGGHSRAAVIAFQKWQGLVRDGIPGPVTQRALADARRPRPLTRAPGTRVEILLERQVLLFIRRGRVARLAHVSTGKPRFATPSGRYEVFRKKRRGVSIPYEVRLPYASYFVRGIAVHQARSVPVWPASHGCVRATRYDAKWLYRRMPVGMPVRVIRR